MEKIYLEAKAKKDGSPIEKVIKKLGIPYPNDSLGFIHARYASFNEANGNKVLLAESVKEDVKTLRFTQANKNHNRQYGPILGSVLDAWVNEETNEIEIVFSFYKSLYPEMWEEAVQDLENGDLTVSFELAYKKADLETLSGGIKKIKHCQFDGVGVLFKGTKPAFKDAHCLEFAIQEIEYLLKNEDRTLVYASIQDIGKKWAKIGELIEEALSEKNSNLDNNIKEDLNVNKKDAIIAELGEELVKDWTDADFEDEVKIEAARKLKKEKIETKECAKEETVETTELATEEVVEEVKNEEASKVERTTTENVVVEDQEAQTTVTKNEETVIKVDDQEVEKTVTMTTTTYTYAEMEAVKAEYEVKLKEKEEALAKKDTEIAFIKENAKRIIEIRNDLGEFVANLSDEELFDKAKMELAQLKKENALLKAKSEEIAPKTMVASEETATETIIASEPEKPVENADATLAEDNSPAAVENRIKEYVKSRKQTKK